MKIPSLIQIEKQASDVGLLLRVQVRRPLGLWALRIVVAESVTADKVKILGEMKAWAYSGLHGLQLDTMRVVPGSKYSIGDLIWLSTMAWALEETPCKYARLLAINDDEKYHSLLKRYFGFRGFSSVRQIGNSLFDLPLRMVWGGSGMLMTSQCQNVFNLSLKRWHESLDK